MQSYEFYFCQQNFLAKIYHFTNKKHGIIGLHSDNSAFLTKLLWLIIQNLSRKGVCIRHTKSRIKEQRLNKVVQTSILTFCHLFQSVNELDYLIFLWRRAWRREVFN